MFQFIGWMRKNFIHRNFSWKVWAETWDASCFRKGLLEKQKSDPNNCKISPLKKDNFSELNRCIFQISLKYIKLVIPNILFILVLCNFLIRQPSEWWKIKIFKLCLVTYKWQKIIYTTKKFLTEYKTAHSYQLISMKNLSLVSWV